MKKIILVLFIILLGKQAYTQSTTIRPETFSYYSIPHQAFIPEISGFSYTFVGGGFMFANGTSGTASVAAPVNLPENSRVTSIKFVVLDNSTSNIICRFQAITSTGGIVGINSGSTSGASSSVQTITFNSNHLINNSTNAYYIKFSLTSPTSSTWTGSDLLIYSAIIQYKTE